MQLISQSFQDGQAIPGEFAFAVPDAASHVALSSNRNPHLAWSGAPAGTPRRMARALTDLPIDTVLDAEGFEVYGG